MPDTTGSAQAGAPSQAQTVSNEPDQVAAADPQALVDARSEADVAEDTTAAGVDAPVQHFEGSIAKYNRDGDLVLSDHLMPGERLARDAQVPDNLSEERNPTAVAEVRSREAAQQRRDTAREEALADEDEADEEADDEPANG